MQQILKKATEFFDLPIDLKSRFAILAGALLVIPIFYFPLWQFKFESDRYPDGLILNVYSYTIEGGTESDLLEINALNHYLGMQSIEEEEILQFQWFPFLLGVTIMLALRVIVLGKMSKLVDLFFFTAYLEGFSFWSFWNMIQNYGHKINPFATVHVEPFDPPLIGQISIAHVQMISSPYWGVLFFLLVPLAFLFAIWMSRRTWKLEHQPRKDYIG
ncbi:MAG: hypothetical protein WEB37_06895 [Bacteroidota bacterium]